MMIIIIITGPLFLRKHSQDLFVVVMVVALLRLMWVLMVLGWREMEKGKGKKESTGWINSSQISGNGNISSDRIYNKNHELTNDHCDRR